MKKFAKIFAVLLALMLVASVTVIPAMAETVTGVSGVEVTATTTGSSNPCITESNGTVTVTAKGTIATRKQTTVTVTNTSGSTATISFDYSVSNHDSSVSTIDDLCGADSGTYSVLLTAGATKTFVVSSKRAINATATATLSNFKVEAAASESNVTVTYGSLGSVKIDGTTVESGSVNAVSSASGASFVAVPGSGNKFVAWINPATNAVLSTSATYQLIPTEAMTIRAVFANASAAPVFWADGTSKLFESLDAAVSYASSASNKVITLASDATLPAGDYTIPAGVTLNIPYDAAGTLCTTEPTTAQTQSTVTGAFRTLNMASGANLTVNGVMSLSAQVSCAYGYNGMPYGTVPFVKMASGSKITVENGANLYAWGFITGSGSVEVKSGGTVYECFQIADYRGGDATSAIVGKDDEYGVFPFNQYYVQNIEVPMTIHAGAVENGYTAVYVTIAGVQSSDVPFIGSENTMFIIDSGYVVKDYVEGTGRLKIDVYGDVTVSTISLDMKVSFVGDITIDSTKYALPIAQHMTVNIESGTINIGQSVALLPGSEFYIKEGANCVLAEGEKIIVYDLDQWLYNNGANGYSGTTNLPYMKTRYVPGGDNTTGRLKDALIQVDGTVDASAGAIYCTSGGANIYSTGTGVISLTPGTETVTYQVITADTDISSWPEIALIAPVLRNADSSTVSADAAGEYKYYASTGRWDRPSHFYESVVTAPTCVNGGYTTHTCAVCGTSYTDSATEATGIHTEVIDAAVAATCTQGGLTEGKHCSVCGTVTVAQEDVYPLGHTEVTDAAVDATCTENGLTEGKHCSVCNEVTVAQEVISALGHTEEIDAAEAATCENPGLTEGKHCSACGEVLVAQEEVAALGHSYATVTVEPTYIAAGSKTHTCSNCGDVVTEEIAKLANPVKEYNVSLSDNINLNFVMNLAETDVVTVNGVEVTAVDGVISIDLAAAQMCDEIAITVNGLPLEKTYSVKGYADAILADSSQSAYHDLVKAMLVYGAASQKYFGYNTGNLASADASTAVVPETTTDIALSDNIDGLDFYGASLSYRNKVAVRFYFTAALSGYTVNVDGYTYTVGENYVEIAGILPQDLGNQITVTVTDAAGNVISVSYGPMNYIVRMNAKGSETAKALVQALYGYYLEAKEVTA